ncbi:hypothetical protein LX32DRAFT_640054 [Colletotrichum zoysiae]|uniref:Uncharacterized protein n=1 Tax=Colletotrichum zoysiae TaxID=1216348 RepID=A0AAD9HHY4_9PEZI|nr:hypothetical protein LX32DRAFT_640054 [Colletotrichum zoysiae]
MSGNGLVGRARRACHVRARHCGQNAESYRYESGAQRDWFPLAPPVDWGPLLASISDQMPNGLERLE